MDDRYQEGERVLVLHADGRDNHPGFVVEDKPPLPLLVRLDAGPLISAPRRFVRPDRQRVRREDVG